MAQGRVSKSTVDMLSCPPGKDRAFLWDERLAGFGVVAFPQTPGSGASAKKVYVAQYRQDGRSRRIKIGAHGVLTADQARDEAKKLLGAVAKGEDPIARRREAKAVPIFRDIASDFMARHVRTKQKPATYAAYDILLRKHILPAIGSKRVSDIKRSDVARLHDDMVDTPGAANRALSVVSAIWNWAAKDREDAVPAKNPAQGIERYGEEGRERFLTPEEFGRLGDTLSIAETTGLPYAIDQAGAKAKHAPRPENRIRSIDPFAVAAIRLLMLTGARLREVLHAEWRHIDFGRGLLNLPTSKTGKKSIYLSAAALLILESLPRVPGCQFVIASTKSGAARSDLKRPWAAITAAAGLPGLRIHDLRHSFASIGAGASLGLPIIGRLLGHTQPATTARYSHLDADPMKRAVDTIGATITAALNRGTTGDVVPIRRKAG